MEQSYAAQKLAGFSRDGIMTSSALTSFQGALRYILLSTNQVIDPLFNLARSRFGTFRGSADEELSTLDCIVGGQDPSQLG